MSRCNEVTAEEGWAGMLDKQLLAPHALAAWAAKTPEAPVLVHVDGERRRGGPSVCASGP